MLTQPGMRVFSLLQISVFLTRVFPYIKCLLSAHFHSFQPCSAFFTKSQSHVWQLIYMQPFIVLHYYHHISLQTGRFIEFSLANRYPASKYPVMAFRGAPAVFPVRADHRELQRYLVFSDKVSQMADDYIEKNFPNQTFVGLHLRNGPDWVNYMLISHNYCLPPPPFTMGRHIGFCFFCLSVCLPIHPSICQTLISG